ncbi:hypothetical protein GCM10011360_08690 [Primorskyibacter flagellatus]|uniref:Uncharacterized protein n=1 Tax=Primorskyibacter flagellatus TaxID=1387277 RepID=A0A917A1J3_9RHOB|nr:hypothetical protein [Primorskyibacter flagellatus]GGE22441.1 hypothetical protein GCM10011360_08690 [Primorskyibacter flagellatus]
MSFLPYGRARFGDWLSAVGVSVLTHGGIVALLLTASVPLLPTIRPEDSAEGDLIVSLEILDAVIASDQDTDDLPLTELEETTPDTLAPVDPDTAETLAPEEQIAEQPAETLETAQEETLLPEETEPEDPEAVAEAEPEVTEPEVTEAEPVDAEDIAPVEPEVAEAEQVAPQTPPETVPETAEVIEEAPEPEPAPELTQAEPDTDTRPEILAEVAPEPDAPEPEVAQPESPIPAQPDPDDLLVDDLNPIDDTILSPLAEGGAAVADLASEASDPAVVLPDPVAPEPELTPEVQEEDFAALVIPEETPAPDAPSETPDTAALPLPETPATEPEQTPEPEVRAEPEQPADPAPDQTAAAPRPAPIANPTPAALAVGQLLRTIRATPAPDCALALPRRSGDGGVGVSFIGTDEAALDNYAQRVLAGQTEPPAQSRERIDARQCAALDVVRAVASYPANRIGLALDSTQLSSGDSLRGRIIGAGGLFITVLLIDDNGVVQDLSRFIELDGDTPVLDAPVSRSGETRSTRQILLVLGTRDVPLDLSDRIGDLADSVFAPLDRALLQDAVFGLATFDVR